MYHWFQLIKLSHVFYLLSGKIYSQTAVIDFAFVYFTNQVSILDALLWC